MKLVRNLTKERGLNMSRETAPSTVALREAFDQFVLDFEQEYRYQATKTNSSSERRMRKLLRSFSPRVYEGYRDATLPSRQSEETPQSF